MTIETRFTERLRARIAELKDGAHNTVLSFRLGDFTEYRYSAGYVQALNDVAAVMDEILTEIERE